MYHDELRKLMDDYVHLTYKITRTFPQEERYGSASQLRRAALSVILNYIEGFARRRNAVLKNFLEISYGSLQESKYLVQFSYVEKYLTQEDFRVTNALADRIGAMLWGILEKMN